jgi:predicted nucleotidyltransferase component of viral defense system
VIDRQEIEQKSSAFGINPADVEKDYVYGWILNGMHTQSSLGDQLVLKGGNGLRKAYLPSTRFSKDLDFSCQEHIDSTFLSAELNRICEFVEKQAQVCFSTSQTIVKNKDLSFGVEAVEARLYFKGFYGEEKIILKAQLDITQFEKLYLPIQTRQLIHPYSDNEQCAVAIRCQKIEEMLASKLTTLLHRRKAIDLFDLLYSILFNTEFAVNRQEIITTFLRKSIFGPQPTLARDQLLAVPLEEFKPLWSTIVAPFRSLFNFDYVVSNFKGLIESLFKIGPRPLSSAWPQGFREPNAIPRVTTRSPSGRTMPTFFSWNFRNVIVAAARSQTLIELTYDGLRRLIEPYKIEYYVRQSDGIGSEYFWGFDNTGGKSGRIGIKQFFCNKIQSARPTDIPFIPRYQVEL